MTLTTQQAPATNKILSQLQLLSNNELNLGHFFDKMYLTGRPRKMTYDMVIEAFRCKTTYYCETWKGVYKYLLENKNWILPCYGNFLKTVKTFTSYLVILINKTVMYNYMEFMIRPDRVSFVDSTSLPVCKTIRAGRHKTMKGLAKFSKSTTGWYLGLKLHLICDYSTRKVISYSITESTYDDRRFLGHIMLSPMFKYTKTLFVADKGYLGPKLETLARETGNYFISGKKASKKQRGLLSQFDIYLIHNHAKIETLFSNLKLNYSLVSTRSRSKLGYFFNYIFGIFSLVQGQK